MSEPLVICVCGTDTGAGKTVVTAGLLAALERADFEIQAIKPIQTGCLKDKEGNLLAPDVLVYRQAALNAPAQALISLEDACSPHLAAVRAGLEITVSSLMIRLETIVRKTDISLVEAAGGLFCPLNERELMIDLFSAISARFETRIVLAAPNKLGVINQALLNLAILQQRKLPPAGLILTQTGPASHEPSPLEAVIQKENQSFICETGNIECLAEIPYLPALSQGESISATEKDWPAPDGPERYRRNEAWKILAELLSPTAQKLIQPRSPGLTRPIYPEEDQSRKTRQLLSYDRDHLWHPYTSALKPLKAWEACRTEGAYIHLRSAGNDGLDFDGQVLDGMASWWAAIHGYRHPALMAALAEQASIMPHVMFGGLTHEPATALARKLLELAPSSLRRVFLADSGSVAVEVALKMAVQYQQAAGRQSKSSILAIRGGYHGDTLGAMSICDPVNGMHHLFSGLLPGQRFAPRPQSRFAAPFDPADVNGLKKLIREHQSSLAAVVLEPIVQGAGGMWFYHPEYLKALRELCDRHELLLILDEIATGFGRTGKMFACQWAEIEPDIMCVGKALTGGVMTLAAVLSSEKVACGLSEDGGVLMHGPTFMGNPLACSVACASLNQLSAYPWEEKIKRMESLMLQYLPLCLARPGVDDVRVLGGIGVVEMKNPVNVEKLQDFFVREHGVWIRPFGKLIYIMPPYIVTPDELTKLCEAINEAVEKQKWA